MKKNKAAKAAPQTTKMGIPAQAPTDESMDMSMGTNIHPRLRGAAADGVSEEEEMADVEEEEATGEARDVMMTETEIAYMTATDTDTETEAGALATID